MKFLALLIVAGLCGLPAAAIPATPSRAASTGRKKLTVALLPKSKGNAYFVSCKRAPIGPPGNWASN